MSRYGLILGRLVVGLIIIVSSVLVSVDPAQAQTSPQAVTCTGFELRNMANQAVITSGSSVTAGTRISYLPTGCTTGWNPGTRTATVTNFNTFPTNHTQCADAGSLCQVTAVYMGEGTRLYWRTNLSKIINSSQYFCRYTGGWD